MMIFFCIAIVIGYTAFMTLMFWAAIGIPEWLYYRRLRRFLDWEIAERIRIGPMPPTKYFDGLFENCSRPTFTSRRFV